MLWIFSGVNKSKISSTVSWRESERDNAHLQRLLEDLFVQHKNRKHVRLSSYADQEMITLLQGDVQLSRVVLCINGTICLHA